MNLPKQIHLTLDNGNYRLSIINNNNTSKGWHPAASDEDNSSYLVPPDLLPELLHRLFNGELNEQPN